MPAPTTYPAVTTDLITSLATRDEIPALLDERRLFGCGVEVGVQQGAYSAILLDGWAGSHLISVDPWFEDAPGDYRDIANLPQNVQDSYYELTRARLRRFGKRSSIWRLTSVEAAERIPNFSLDFVYLDARHDYASVLEDLDAWYEKVRPGGILAGHDYIDGDFAAGVFGVKSAVDDFCRARGLTVHATIEDKPWVSWIVEIPHTLPSRSESVDLLRHLTPTEIVEHLSLVQMAITIDTGSFEYTLALDRRCPVQAEIERALNGNQLYQPELSALIARGLKPGDSFLDVGAHVGYFTFLASAMVGRSGRVISIEERPEYFLGLANNLKLNGSANIVALSPRVGDSSIGTEDEVTIDGIVERYSLESLKMVRIGLAGGAGAALRGARRTLSSNPVPFVLTEVATTADEPSGAEMREEMRSLGYETFRLHRDGAEHLRPDRTISEAHLLLFRHVDAPAV